MVTYTGFGTVIQKSVNVSPDGVNITLRSDKEFKAHIELWRWVMTSINRVSVKDVSNATSIAATKSIGFMFDVPSPQGLGRGSVLMSTAPTEIKIWPYREGVQQDHHRLREQRNDLRSLRISRPSWAAESNLEFILPFLLVASCRDIRDCSVLAG